MGILFLFKCLIFDIFNSVTALTMLPLYVNSNVLFLTSDNEFLGIICSLFRGRQNIFLTIFGIKFVVKCATKILEIG